MQVLVLGVSGTDTHNTEIEGFTIEGFTISKDIAAILKA